MHEHTTSSSVAVRRLLSLLAQRLAMRRRIRRLMLGKVLRRQWHGLI
mgnify:CR=1 FL=1